MRARFSAARSCQSDAIFVGSNWSFRSLSQCAISSKHYEVYRCGWSFKQLALGLSIRVDSAAQYPRHSRTKGNFAGRGTRPSPGDVSLTKHIRLRGFRRNMPHHEYTHVSRFRSRVSRECCANVGQDTHFHHRRRPIHPSNRPLYLCY